MSRYDKIICCVALVMAFAIVVAEYALDFKSDVPMFLALVVVIIARTPKPKRVVVGNARVSPDGTKEVDATIEWGG